MPKKHIQWLEAYFDESGTGGQSPAIVVAGFVAKRERWRRFEDAWQRLLSDMGIESFHMTDCENRQGIYKEWSQAQRVSAIKRAHFLIGRTALFGVSAGVPLADYERQVRGTAYERTFGPPYALAAKLALYETGKVAYAAGYDLSYRVRVRRRST